MVMEEAVYQSSVPVPVITGVAAVEIRELVFANLAQADLETGGVLLGRSGPEGVQITGAATAEALSAFDPGRPVTREIVEAVEGLLGASPGTEKSRPVGWYRSSPAGAVSVRPGDVLLMSHFFPEPGSVLLLLERESGEGMVGHSFLRGPDGDLSIEPAGAQLFAAAQPAPAAGPARPSRNGSRGFLLMGAAAASVILAFGAGNWWAAVPGPRAPALVTHVTVVPAFDGPDPRDSELAGLRRSVEELSARNRRLEIAIGALRSAKVESRHKPVRLKVRAGRRR